MKTEDKKQMVIDRYLARAEKSMSDDIKNAVSINHQYADICEFLRHEIIIYNNVEHSLYDFLYQLSFRNSDFYNKFKEKYLGHYLDNIFEGTWGMLFKDEETE